MKNRPMKNVMKNHIRSFRTSPRSAAQTPNCAVKLEATRTTVMVDAHGTFRWASGQAPRSGSPVITDRMVKYIANSAAKNMSSLASQTMVPTLTRSGRFAAPCAGVGAVFGFAVAVATGALLRHLAQRRTRPPVRRRISTIIDGSEKPGHPPARDSDVTVAIGPAGALLRHAVGATPA